jgi:hypothetical protein
MPTCATCGAADCAARFQTLLARDYADVRFFGVHRMLVDAYALQHPDVHCISTKSMLAHLCGLACAFEYSGSAPLFAALKRSLDGVVAEAKPHLPEIPRTFTIEDVCGTDDPAEHATRVQNWARAMWDGYASLHGFARAWLATLS